MNAIPVILPESIVPPRTRDPIDADVGEGCQHRTFSATVIDYDGAEFVHFKWILTATVESGGSTTSRTFELVENTVSASDLRIDTVVPGLEEHAPDARVYKDLSLDFTRERLLTVVDPDVVVPETGSYTHLLQLWVSDRAFAPGVANVTPQTPEGAAPQPAESASWLIQILDTGVCNVVEGGT